MIFRVLLGVLGMSTLLFAADVDLEIYDVRSDKGQVLIALFDQAKAFPTKPDLAIRTAIRKIESDKEGAFFVRYRFKGLNPGSYAISVVHDENANGRLDMTVVFPAEGYGTSNDIRGLFGPPSFRDAKFEVKDRPRSLRVRMGY